MPRLWIPYKRKPNNDIVDLMIVQCGFCQSTNMNKDTLTCDDCNTTAPNSTIKKKVGKKKDAV